MPLYDAEKMAQRGFFIWGDYLDNDVRNAALRRQIKKKKGGRTKITAKYHTKYPDGTEREYIRLCNAYMTLENRVLVRHIPDLKHILQDGVELRTDSADDDAKRKTARVPYLGKTVNRIQDLFDKIKTELALLLSGYGLPEKLDRIADMGHKMSVKEWKKQIHKTLGINIMEDYYLGELYKSLLQEWVSENVELIQTIPSDSLNRMKEIVYVNYIEGKTTTDIVKRIQKQYAMDKNHARMIAKDQTAKLNAAITKKQQQDAGINCYEWSDSGDSRVRACHLELNGHIFHWDNPPEMWYMTKIKGKVMTGRHCHPGEDYQCRCCALPVFDIDQLELPV